MFASLLDSLLNLPTARHRLDSMADALVAHQQLMVLYPEGTEIVCICEALSERLRRQRHEPVTESIEWVDDTSPLSILSERWQAAWPSQSTPRTTENLLRAVQGKIDIGAPIFILYGNGPLKRTRAWADFLFSWAVVVRDALHRRTLPTLCLILPAAHFVDALPVPMHELLSIQWWWAIPSALEMHVLCRESKIAGDVTSPSRWCESILASLAGNDLFLLEHLSHELHRPIEDIINMLRADGLRRGWTHERLFSWGYKKLFESRQFNNTTDRSSPPIPFRRLWSEGALSATQEYGTELHTSALAVLGLKHVIKHRIWRGQVSVLLPLIDALRLDVCQRLTAQLGQGWQTEYRTPETALERDAMKSNPNAVELGFLLSVLCYLRTNSSRQIEDHVKLIDLIGHLHRVRNSLAHYDPVTQRDYEAILVKAKLADVTSPLSWCGDSVGNGPMGRLVRQ